MEIWCSSGLSLKWKFSSGSVSTAWDPSGCWLAPSQESKSYLHLHMCKGPIKEVLSKPSCMSLPLFPHLVPRTVKIPDSADGLGFQIRGFGPSVVHAVGRGKRSPPLPLELSGFIRKRPPIIFPLLWHSWQTAATPIFRWVCVTWPQEDNFPAHSLHVAQLVH